jgi:hypothetical protein
VLVLLCSAALLEPGAAAHAQTAEAASPAPSPADVAKAKALFDAGGRAYDAGDFETAIQAFEQAYKLVRREGLVFSLAQAHRRQHTVRGRRENLDRAIALYRQYLALVPTGGRRSEAAKALGELEAIAGAASSASPTVPPEAPPEAKPPTRLSLSVAVEGATISIDGGAERAAPFSTEVEPGPRRVRVRASGYRDKELVLVAIEGELVPVNDIQLEELPARLTVDTDEGAAVSIDGRYVGEAPLTRALELPSGRRFVAVTNAGHHTRTVQLDLGRGEARTVDLPLTSTTQRDLAWVGFAGSGVLLVSSGVLAGFAFARQSQAIEIDARPSAERRALSVSERDEYQSLRSERDRLVVGASTLAGLGVVVGAVGLGLYAFDQPDPVRMPEDAAPSKDEDTPPARPGPGTLELAIRPAVGPDGAYLGLTGRLW